MKLFIRVPYGHPTRLLGGVVLLMLLCLTTRQLYVARNRPPARNIYTYTEGATSPWRNWNNETGGRAARTDEAAFLAGLASRHRLTKDVPFFARRVRPQFDKGGGGGTRRQKKIRRPSLARAPAAFMDGTAGFRRVHVDESDLAALSDLRAAPGAALALPLGGRSPFPHEVDAGALLVGVATTPARLGYAGYAALRDWSRWLTDGRDAAAAPPRSNGAGLVLALHRGSPAEADDVRKRLEELGIEAEVLLMEAPEAEQQQPAGGPHGRLADLTARYLELVGVLANRAGRFEGEGRQKQWLALVDDDVFLPSMGKLLQKLDRLDWRQKQYVGLPSERADWVVDKKVAMTYGGAAVFLTPSMAEAVSQLPCLHNASSVSDVSSDTAPQWDMLLYNCISSHTSVDLQVVPSLYSPVDDALGIYAPSYESGVQAYALHHARNRHRFEPGRAHLAASLCGEACFLQRLLWRDGWLLVNGYALAHYPDGVDGLSLGKATKMVAQYGPDEGGGELAVAPRLRVDDADREAADREILTWTGKKRSWKFLDARIASNGELWQAYVKRRGNANSWSDGDERSPGDVVHTMDEPSDVDSVILLIWEPS